MLVKIGWKGGGGRVRIQRRCESGVKGSLGDAITHQRGRRKMIRKCKIGIHIVR